MQANDPIALSLTHRLLLVLLALLGAALVLVSTSNYGAGLTPDSVGYIGAARHIIAGDGVLSFDGYHLVVQPPLYPALLATVGGLFGMDPLLLITAVNAILFGLIVYFAGLLAFKYLSSFPILALIGSLAVLASVPLLKVSIMAWSEPLFILLLLFSIMFANAYLEKQDIASLLLFSVSVALSALTRYVGIALLVWGTLIIVLFCRGSRKTRIIHTALFNLVPVLLIGVWLFRNYAIAGTPFGPRSASEFGLSQNLMFMFDHVTTWYVPGIIADHRATLLLFGAVIGILAGLGPRDSWENIRVRFRQNSTLALFIIVYSAFLIISSTTTAYDSIGDRLLSPIYIPLTLFLLILIQAFAEPYRKRFSSRIVNFVLVAALAMWLLYPVSNTLLYAQYFAPIGKGYSNKAWRESETVRYIRRHQIEEPTCIMYTNATAAVYVLAHVESLMSPAETSYNSLEAPADVSKLRGIWPATPHACLVLFDDIDRLNLFTIDELRTISTITLIARFNDGAVYSVSREP